jgi:PAS domain S-box-containing protein
MSLLQRALKIGWNAESQVVAERTTVSDVSAEESVWIEIIRRMEGLYAQLADSQAELEKNAQALSEAKELSDNIIRSMSDALIALDSVGRITLVNDAVGGLFGFKDDELIGRTLDVLFAQAQGNERWQWRSLGRRIRRTGSIREEETTWHDRAGNPIPVSVSGSPLRERWGGVVGAVLVVRDLRETKRHIAEARAATAAAEGRARQLEEANSAFQRLQAELIQAEKMSSIGTLAAGVAHELNNPIGAILLYSHLLLDDTNEGDPVRRNVEKLSTLASRCERIVSGLLDFARPAPPRELETNVNSVLKGSLSVLEGHELFHNIDIIWRLNGKLPVLVADPAQLQQAFANVVMNAAEAMEGSGELTIETKPGADPECVLVRISDTGPGIPRELVSRLFDPFFTTKDDGTGLGLAITYSIVERHNGSIEIESEPGEGTAFTLKLGSVKEKRTDA